MRLIKTASVAEVVQVFKDDQLVIKELQRSTLSWPATLSEQIDILRRANRRSDEIQGCSWSLYEIKQCELLFKMHHVWQPQYLPWSWTFMDMFVAYETKTYEWPLPNNVSMISNQLKKNPGSVLPPLVGFVDNSNNEFIKLDDGHNRIVASYIARIPFPRLMYVGQI